MKTIVVAGWIVYAGVYFGFAAARTSIAPWILLPIYGLYQALTEGVTKALVSDVVPKDQRAGAIGLFYTVAGLGQFAASLIGDFCGPDSCSVCTSHLSSARSAHWQPFR